VEAHIKMKASVGKGKSQEMVKAEAIQTTLAMAFIGRAYYSLSNEDQCGKGPILQTREVNERHTQHFRTLWQKFNEGKYLFKQLPVNAVELLVDSKKLDRTSVMMAVPEHNQDYSILRWNQPVAGQTGVVTLVNGYNRQQMVEHLLLQEEKAAVLKCEKKMEKNKEKVIPNADLDAKCLEVMDNIHEAMIEKGMWLANVYDKGG
jgi:hypothetical protein